MGEKRRGEREGGGERERLRERETGIQMDNQTAEAETYSVYMCGVSITAFLHLTSSHFPKPPVPLPHTPTHSFTSGCKPWRA